MLSKSVINGEYIHTRRADGFGLKYMYVCVHYRVMHAQIGQDSSGAGWADSRPMDGLSRTHWRVWGTGNWSIRIMWLG